MKDFYAIIEKYHNKLLKKEQVTKHEVMPLNVCCLDEFIKNIKIEGISKRKMTTFIEHYARDIATLFNFILDNEKIGKDISLDVSYRVDENLSIYPVVNLKSKPEAYAQSAITDLLIQVVIFFYSLIHPEDC